jgi:hypothetical protein
MALENHWMFASVDLAKGIDPTGGEVILNAAAFASP